MWPNMARANNTGFFQQSDFFIGAEGAEGIFFHFSSCHMEIYLCYNTFNHFLTIIVLFRSPIEVFLVP